ncbi:hypothetical protein DFP72DRAFT_1020212 [Ephemerocybe angulata]|uniref:Uncharacterized protein n=1 Tax=Ephemerocybe angulata TaxID=980116 RepID=A0A8H6LTT8_9AGAR|nr:hypothetical protein DFP72DRAFT_1020212 [Tulosesus angulatus]
MVGRRARLKTKGAYNSLARSLACQLTFAGCAPEKIGPLIQKIALSFGVTVSHSMSRRTVKRCVLETLPAAEMQLSYELSVNPGVTISQDSTSNRSINYQAHHIALRAPNYAAGEQVPDPSSIPTSRLLRVDSTMDHSSETAMQTWHRLLRSAFETYNNSPLARRTNSSFSLRKFALKLCGMNTDHASAEKATYDLFKGWKEGETIDHLGEQHLAQMDFDELVVFLNSRKAQLIEKLGGIEAWNALDTIAQAGHEAELMKELNAEIGKDVYGRLPDQRREALNLFVWAGCCMHKDMNSFKGGSDAMAAMWKIYSLVEPILLANKANAAKVRDILNPSRRGTPLTPEEVAAIAASTRGGVKAAALAGALFNNKDDKKGYGDTHIIHLLFEFGLGACLRFPDTSNTRFNSYAEAAAELLKHLEFYIRFLDGVRLRKQRPGWTNIELNLYNALHDEPTLTELAAMVLYAQSVVHPYLRVVRGADGDSTSTNVLNLGPFHQDVRDHCLKIIETPQLLTALDACHTTAALDGKPWHDAEAVSAVQALSKAGRLPHLDLATVAFFQGGSTTWIRFSSEFAPGGTIDKLSLEERDLAWMPATNDVNEGALGAYRVYMRNKPSTTLLSYNAQAVCQKNDTLAFMSTMLTEEDYTYIRRVARGLDESGMERERKKSQAAFENRVAEMKREKLAEAQRKLQERQTRLGGVVIVSLEMVDSLKVPELDEQLDALREHFGDTEIPNKSNRGNKDPKRLLLRAALERHATRSATQVLDTDVPAVVECWTQGFDELEMEMAEEDEQIF